MAQKQTLGHDSVQTRPPVARLAWLRWRSTRFLRFLPWLLGFYVLWLAWFLLSFVSPAIAHLRHTLWVQVVLTAGMWVGIGLMWYVIHTSNQGLKAALRASGHRLCPHCGFTPGEIVLPAPCPECGHVLAANIEEQWRTYEENRKKIVGGRPPEQIFTVPPARVSV